MSKIVVIVGHARTATYCEALGERYAKGAEEGGHQVRLFLTSKMKFDPILHEGFTQVQPLEQDLKEAHDAILAADHLVLIFPLWLGTLPAILKGFLERVMQPDLVESSKQHRFTKLLKGKSARIIVTMGMPRFVYRWWFKEYALKMLRRNILGFLGVARVRSIIFGNVDRAGMRRRQRWLKNVEQLGRSAA